MVKNNRIFIIFMFFNYVEKNDRSAYIIILPTKLLISSIVFATMFDGDYYWLPNKYY